MRRKLPALVLVPAVAVAALFSTGQAQDVCLNCALDDHCCHTVMPPGYFWCGGTCGTFCSVEGADPCPETFAMNIGVDGVVYPKAAQSPRNAGVEWRGDRPRSVEDAVVTNGRAEEVPEGSQTCAGILVGRVYSARVGAALRSMTAEVAL